MEGGVCVKESWRVGRLMGVEEGESTRGALDHWVWCLWTALSDKRTGHTIYKDHGARQGLMLEVFRGD